MVQGIIKRKNHTQKRQNSMSDYHLYALAFLLCRFTQETHGGQRDRICQTRKKRGFMVVTARTVPARVVPARTVTARTVPARTVSARTVSARAGDSLSFPVLSLCNKNDVMMRSCRDLLYNNSIQVLILILR